MPSSADESCKSGERVSFGAQRQPVLITRSTSRWSTSRSPGQFCGRDIVSKAILPAFVTLHAPRSGVRRA